MRYLLILIVMFAAACAHEPTAEAPPVPAAVQPAPTRPQKTKIKYVYVETPATESAMTIEPYEPAPREQSSFTQDVVKIFWPLLTMMATGAVFIAILFVENKIITKQLAQRRSRQSA